MRVMTQPEGIERAVCYRTQFNFIILQSRAVKAFKTDDFQR